jgi:hypothetical protein
MISGLWALTRGLSTAVVVAAVPPACRRAVQSAPPPARANGGEVVIEAPPWPAAGGTHFVPSFTALTAAAYTVRLELSARVGGAWSPWVAGVALGPEVLAPLPPAPELGVDVDVFRTSEPVEAVRARARLRGAGAVLDAPWMLALSAASAAAPAPGEDAPGAAADVPGACRLPVPALSQTDADPALAHRICSPTCVAMVLGYWGRPVSPGVLAAEIFHPPTDLYGVWPAAIVAAGQRGVAGYLLRFPDWAAAAWCLGRRLPVIASVRYRAGELAGAAIAETAGHLVVLTGHEGEEALVNDPAAPAAAVARRYRVKDLVRVWLERSGVGYVLFPPAGPAPAA